MTTSKRQEQFLLLAVAIGGIISVIAVAGWHQDAVARGFRTGNWIATPQSFDRLAPVGATPVERLRPVDRRLVIKAVHALADAWNTGKMAPLLDETRFYNKDCLLDTLNEDAPRDERLMVRSIGAIATLRQYMKPVNGRRQQISIVSASVDTQIEFNDSNRQLIRLRGRNEFVLEIAQPATGR